MSQFQYNRVGANPNVNPYPNAIGQAGPTPAADNTALGQYPPNAAGNTPTRVLPSWLHAAVEGFKAKMRPSFSAASNISRQAPNQGIYANAVALPAGQAIPYGMSPRQYTAFIDGANLPIMGGSNPPMFTTLQVSMDDQPAFEINGPMYRGHDTLIIPTYPIKAGLPTFFPVGNRCLNGNTGTGVDSHPTGVTYLAVPPDRYRRPNRAQPVRGQSGISGGHISRGRTLPLAIGS